jgi:hypothetical protein
MLPRPASIFDAPPPERYHSSVATGVLLNTHIDRFRNVLGLICPGKRHLPHRVIMRGVPGEPENDALVDAAAGLSRKMTEWLKNAPMMIEFEGGGEWGGHNDMPLGKGLPEFAPLTVDRWTVTGRIEERPNRTAVQGEPQYIYTKRIFLQSPTPGELPLECKPVVIGRGWA